MTTVQLLKNKLSRWDRELGYRYWRRRWDRHPDQGELLFHHQLPDSEMAIFFNDLAVQDAHSRRYHLSIGESYVRSVEGPIDIEGSTGWCFDDERVLKHSYPYAEFPWRNEFYPHLLFHQMRRQKGPHRIIDQAINLLWHGWDNYYHFLIDIVPTLDLVLEREETKGSKVLVPSRIGGIKFVNDFLSIYPQYTRQLDLVHVDLHEFVRVHERLILPKVSRFLRLPQLLLSEPHSNSPKRIFLKRPLSGARAIDNVDEVQSMLTGFGFTAVDSSSLPLMEQMSLFSNFDTLVGIHGAGMTNMLFSRMSNARVIEIFPGNRFRPLHYQHLAHMKGYDYGFVLGSEVSPGSNDHFRLDPAILEDLLRETLTSEG